MDIPRRMKQPRARTVIHAKIIGPPSSATWSTSGVLCISLSPGANESSGLSGVRSVVGSGERP